MKTQIFFDAELNCVVGRFKGYLTMAAVREYIREVTAIATKHPCGRFLNDLRNAKIALSIADLYQCPGIVITEGFDRRWRRAILLAPTADLDHLGFYELAATNRGLAVKLFTDVDKAIQWLNIGSNATLSS